MASRILPAAALVTLLAAALLGSGLGASALYEPDEARHAEIGREMGEVESWRDRMTPRLDGVPYRNKPAPFYWLLAASFALLGVGEVAARAPSVVAALATALAVTCWGAARWGPRTGLLAGLVLLTAPQFLLLARFATPDMTVTCWTTLGIFAVYRFVERQGSSLVPAAAAGAVGLLVKGLIAPGLIALVGLASLALRGRLRLLTPRAMLLAGGVFVAIALPWHLVVARDDPSYLHRLYVDQQWLRAVDAGERLHARPLLFYVPVLLAGFFPWSMLLPATVLGTLWPGRRDDGTIFCALWAGAVLTVFSLAEGKVGSYILPAFPPLALLTARFLGLLFAGLAGRAERGLATAGLWASAGVLLVTPAVTIVAGVRIYGGALLATSLWSLLLLAPAGALGALLARHRLRPAVATLACSSILLPLAFYHLAAPSLSQLHSDASLAQALRRMAPDHAAAPLIAFRVRSASLRFYLGRPILLREHPHQLRRLLARHPRLFVLTSPRHVADLESAGPFVPWAVAPRRVLYGSAPPPAAASRPAAATGLGGRPARDIMPGS